MQVNFYLENIESLPKSLVSLMMILPGGAVWGLSICWIRWAVGNWFSGNWILSIGFIRKGEGDSNGFAGPQHGWTRFSAAAFPRHIENLLSSYYNFIASLYEQAKDLDGGLRQ